MISQVAPAIGAVATDAERLRPAGCSPPLVGAARRSIPGCGSSNPERSFIDESQMTIARGKDSLFELAKTIPATSL
jgi:hypothetical protein